MIIVDQLNRTISFQETPKRIVSLVPSQTELLCDLGLEEFIVGVTKFCVHPNHLRKSKTIVGGTKELHIDRVKALKPDVILCNKEENTQDIVLACAKIAPVHISDVISLEDNFDMIQQYGKMFSVEQQAKTLVAEINHEYISFKDYIQELPKIKVTYFIWRKPWMVVANNTFIHELLKVNGFVNVYADSKRYPEVQLESPDRVPELVLLSSEPYPFKEKHLSELKAFFPCAKILLVDGEMFSWYGSRLKKAFTYFKEFREEFSEKM
ncbi:ABC transporter substrate-binding protein [Mangrovimonas aestuarii]|uniref:ABC transporter substrate-binding protein n=1 Tax=Mangrovimonas aestuarii TaxID=3018443 RepID=UPI002378EC61|nr:helical backbone metal receptor [Mangrovimonas aestuarii]